MLLKRYKARAPVPFPFAKTTDVQSTDYYICLLFSNGPKTQKAGTARKSRPGPHVIVPSRHTVALQFRTARGGSARRGQPRADATLIPTIPSLPTVRVPLVPFGH